MAKSLTKKQKGFVKDYIATGNGTQAALKNYDTEDYKTASVIATENLDKPSIVLAIKDALPDELLAAKHLALLNSTRIEHMVFPLGPERRDKAELDTSKMPKEVATMLDAEMALRETKLTDEDITQMLAEVNCKVRTIVHGETARHVYFWAADNKAVKDALDMAYKVKGTYAPEKSASINLNVDVPAESNIMELAAKAAELLKAQKV